MTTKEKLAETIRLLNEAHKNFQLGRLRSIRDVYAQAKDASFFARSIMLDAEADEVGIVMPNSTDIPH